MAASMKVMGAFLLLIIAVIHATSSPVKSKSVTAILESKWWNTPYLLEISEFLAEENSDYFWNFVHSLSSLDLAKTLGADSGDEELYNLGLKYAQQLLSPMAVKLLKFSLSIRANSPKIEMFNQIVKDLPPPDGCDCFVEIHGEMTCVITEIDALISTASNRLKPNIFNLDHSYPGSNGAVIVVLYGNIGQQGSQFPKFHQYLKNLVTKGEITYILRHYVQDQPDNKVRLSGYGVELAIKSTEYKAIDDSQVKDSEEDNDEFSPEGEDDVQGFVFSTLRQKHPELEDKLRQLRTHLIDSSLSTTPLKIWQLQEISLQAAQRVLSAPTDDALRIMRDISQNFPTKARSLVKTHVKKELKDEIRKNQDHIGRHLGLSAGDAQILLNGLQIDTDIADPFMLLDLFRSESRLMEGLYSLALTSEEIKKFMQISSESNDDSYAIDIRDHAVEYINDLETDKKYSHWLRSVQDLLRPSFPGMLRQVRKNFFHLTFIIDPTDPMSGELLQQADSFHVNQAPTKIGVVFVVNDDRDIDGRNDVGVAIVRAYNFAKSDRGAGRALNFITRIYKKAGNENVTVQGVIDQINKVFPGEDIDDILGEDSDYDDKRMAGKAFFERTGLGELPQVLINGVPLKKDELDPNAFEEAVLTDILHQTGDFQKSVWQGDITDNTDLLDYLMSRPNVMPRLNPRVLTPGIKHIDLSSSQGSIDVNNFKAFSQLTTGEMSATITKSMKYITKRDDYSIRPVTNWIVCDVEDKPGRLVLQEAIKQMKSSNKVRVGVLHNPTDVPTDGSHWLARAINAALETQTRNNAKNFIVKLLKEENIVAVNNGKKKKVPTATLR